MPANSTSYAVSADIAALKQKGILESKGFFSDPSFSNLTASFSTAASLAGSLSGIAQSVASISEKTKTNTIRNKTNNYFLYDSEKELLAKKAKQLSDYGLIPYDVVKEFLEILVSVPKYEDLSYIAQVVQITELDNPSLVREPVKILNIPTLYKVGYLATAVASIVKDYDPQFNVQSAIDSSSGLFGNVFDAISSGGGLQQFGPVLDVLTNLSHMTSLVGGLQGTTSGFTSFSGISDIAQLPNVIQSMSDISTQLNSAVALIGKAKVHSMLPTGIDMSVLAEQATQLTNMAKRLSGIATMLPGGGDPRVQDVARQMASLNTQANDLASKISTMTSALSAFPIPSINGQQIEIALNKLGGQAISAKIAELTVGQKIPPSVLYKNPMLVAPSYIGKALMGELAGAAVAIGEIFPKKIATYAEPSAGVGTVAFGMQNFASFAADGKLAGMNLESMVSKILFNTNSAPSSPSLQALLTDKVEQVASILNVATDAVVEARRSDNAIPFMIGMTCALVEDTKCPIDTGTFSEAWKRSASVANDIQNYNNTFLETCKTLL